jgi:hypothetical protein
VELFEVSLRHNCTVAFPYLGKKILRTAADSLVEKTHSNGMFSNASKMTKISIHLGNKVNTNSIKPIGISGKDVERVTTQSVQSCRFF